MNKYAKIYFSKLAEGNIAMNPYVPELVMSGTAPAAAFGGVAGTLGGAGLGLVTSPGYNERGERKSKLMHVLKNMAVGGLGGAAAGGLGGLTSGSVILGNMGLIRKTAGPDKTPLGTPIVDPVPPKVIPNGKLLMPSKKQMVDEGKMDLINYETQKKK